MATLETSWYGDCDGTPPTPEQIAQWEARTSRNRYFFGMTQSALLALYQKLQTNSQNLLGGNVVQWMADGKSEQIRIPSDYSGDQYMSLVFDELQHLNPWKYGRSADRSKFIRTVGIGGMGTWLYPELGT